MVLETERLVLRPFLESDAADVFEYLTEPMANCFACMKLDLLEEAKAEMKNRMGETEWYFAIVLKDTGKVIGEIDAYPEDDNIPSQRLCEKLGMRREGYSHICEEDCIMENEKIFGMYFAKVYPMLLAKAERKGRTKDEVDELAKGKKMEQILRK